MKRGSPRQNRKALAEALSKLLVDKIQTSPSVN